MELKEKKHKNKGKFNEDRGKFRDLFEFEKKNLFLKNTLKLIFFV